MRTIRNLLTVALLASSVGACYPAEYNGGVYAEVAPPAPLEYDYADRPGYVYIQGHWGWGGGQYVWINGFYQPERPGSVWIDGSWGYVGGRWGWRNGYWGAGRPGYSYQRPYWNGSGYAGGGWVVGGNGGYAERRSYVPAGGYRTPAAGGGYRAPAGGGYRPAPAPAARAPMVHGPTSGFHSPPRAHH